MGIIKAAAGSVGGVMADQWRDIFVCGGMPNDVLATRGVKKISERSANTKGEKDVISDGSVIIVNAGQSAIAVDRGEIIGVFTAPGENIFHSDRSKSVFHQGGVKGIFKQAWERVGYGGVSPVYQSILYFDMKEHTGNPVRVLRAVNVKDRHDLTQMDLRVTLSGVFSFRIIDPAVFYKNICGNVTGTVRVKDVLPQLQTELAQGLATALANVSSGGAVYLTDLSEETGNIEETAAKLLTDRWTAGRGFAVTSIALDECRISQGDKLLLQGVERDKAFTDPAMGAAHLTAAQGDAMRIASANQAGGIHSVIAVNKAAPQAAQPTDWQCTCGQINHSNFCENCGAKKPIQ